MTERWRKRLDDLDKVGPDDEVFQRASEGPHLPDAPIPGPSTSTRIVTIVAAFSVFALAIAVFAIPALRLNHGAAGPGSSSLLPLWPVRTLEEAEAIQADADAGAVSATPFLDPLVAATNFGREVMGWRDAAVLASSGVGVYECTVAYAGPPSASIPAAINQVGCNDVQQVVPGSYPSSSASGGWYGYSTSGTPSPFRTFSVYPCDLNGACDDLAGYLDPRLPNIGLRAAVNVTLYQPLGFDKGNVWMVLSAESSFGELPVRAGDSVSNNTSLTIHASSWDGLVLDAGFVATGPDDCQAGGITGSEGGDTKLVVPVSIDAEACPEHVAGFVFLAIRERGSSETVLDPLDPSSSKPLVSLAAVPVIFEVPDEPAPTQETSEASVGPTPTPSITPTAETPVNWTTYTDPLGWTIKVPDSWVTEPFVDDSSLRVTESGSWFSNGAPPKSGISAGPAVPPDNGVSVSIWNTEGGPVTLPGDDSAFPLSFDDLHSLKDGAGGFAGSFRGDGLSFSVYVSFDSNATTEQEVPTVRQMIESISFQPWQTGETRNGWTALSAPRSDVDWQLFGDASKVVAVVKTAGGFSMLGPITTCGEGENMTSSAGGPKLECPDGTSAIWMADGQPDPSNPPAYADPLEVRPVIKAWDGTLLSSLDMTV